MESDDDIGALLQKYTAISEVQSVEKVEQDFDQVTKRAPVQEVTQGLAEVFRSCQTASFGQTLAEVFEQGDSGQRAGMLNQLLDGAGPNVLGSLIGEGLLGDPALRRAGTKAPISPEQAEQFRPEHVQQIADEAEKENPAIVEMMCSFYAQNPALAKPLGGAVLSTAMDNIAQRRQG
jgi:hypothetical protein